MNSNSVCYWFMVVALLISESVSGAQSCTSTADCAPDECCLVQMGRPNTPACAKLRQDDEQCIENSLLDTKVLGFPDGSTINITNVYRTFCPCAGDMKCLQGLCTHPDEFAKPDTDGPH